ncbi:MAG: type II toxin-antitoxin system Phd/YefM family antitoxin [Patescibacteria group bacterium]
MNTVITKEKILFKNGKPDAVILDIGRYEKLLEVAEEKEDLAELKRIKKSKTSFKELKNYLKKSE